MDIFAAGVFLYALLCRTMPFWSESQDLMVANTLHRKVRLPQEVTGQARGQGPGARGAEGIGKGFTFRGPCLCQGLRRMLSRMLSKEAQKRPSAEECLEFFSKAEARSAGSASCRPLPSLPCRAPPQGFDVFAELGLEPFRKEVHGGSRLCGTDAGGSTLHEHLVFLAIEVLLLSI